MIAFIRKIDARIQRWFDARHRFIDAQHLDLGVIEDLLTKGNVQTVVIKRPSGARLHVSLDCSAA